MIRFKKKNKLFEDIYKLIKKYDKIVIGRHVSPDPDAIGGQIALRDAIKMTFPDKDVVAVGAGVSKFKYLGALDRIDEPEKYEGCLMIIVDLPNYARLDLPVEISYNAVLKIDHHPAEDIIGEVDWTDEGKSSACEMITEFLLNSKMKMDKKVAEDLFVGMAFDSDRFLLQNTSAKTFATVSNLLEEFPIDFVGLYEKLYERSLNELKFYGFLISNIKVSENGFGHLEITKDNLKKYKVEPTAPSNMVNDFYFVKELLCWCFITYDERSSLYKVNIRSRGPVINEVASKYNGGGHKFASGCRIKDKDLLPELLKDLDRATEKYIGEENV